MASIENTRASRGLIPIVQNKDNRIPVDASARIPTVHESTSRNSDHWERRSAQLREERARAEESRAEKPKMKWHINPNTNKGGYVREDILPEIIEQ